MPIWKTGTSNVYSKYVKLCKYQKSHILLNSTFYTYEAKI